MKGILGRKIGMTQVFDQDGRLTPVTVIEVTPNVVTQIKTKETDGYEAIQLAFDTKREKLATKASVGITNKAKTTPKRFFKEIRGVNVDDYTLGQEVSADIFEVGEVVDVTGTTKGKGFQGSVKKYGQHRGPMGHGSHYHRGPGSLGTMRPMRVFRGRGLPSHMGVLTVTIQNLEIVMVDTLNNAILVKGNIPGPKKGLVIIKSSVKNPGKVNKRAELVKWNDDAIEEVKEDMNIEDIQDADLNDVIETEVKENEEVSDENADIQEETSESSEEKA